MVALLRRNWIQRKQISKDEYIFLEFVLHDISKWNVITRIALFLYCTILKNWTPRSIHEWQVSFATLYLLDLLYRRNMYLRVNAIEKRFLYSFYSGIKFYKWKRTPVVTMHFQKRCISIQRYELLTRAKACIYLRLGLQNHRND